MRYVIVAFALVGIVISFFALSAHFGLPANQLDLLRSKWNCAYVNQSPYAEVYGVPVAVFGIMGYALLAILALLQRVVLAVYFSGAGLVYALYLTDVQAHVLQVWCAYGVSSLIIMVLIVFLSFGLLIFGRTSDDSQ